MNKKTVLTEIFEYLEFQENSNPLYLINWLESNKEILLKREENEIKKAYHDGWVFAENKTKGVYLEDKYFNDNYGRLEKR